MRPGSAREAGARIVERGTQAPRRELAPGTQPDQDERRCRDPPERGDRADLAERRLEPGGVQECVQVAPEIRRECVESSRCEAAGLSPLGADDQRVAGDCRKVVTEGNQVGEHPRGSLHS